MAENVTLTCEALDKGHFLQKHMFVPHLAALRCY